MGTRHRLWLPFLAAGMVTLLLTMVAASALAAPPTAPASVAIESVGIARSTGCAVVHVAVSEPRAMSISRPSEGERIVAEFPDAVLAPNAMGVLARAPALQGLVTVTQISATPPAVRLEAASRTRQGPEVERFADGRGLVVRLFVDPDAAPAPVWVPTTRPSSPPYLARAGIRLTSATSASPPQVAALRGRPLVAPIDRLGVGGGEPPMSALTDWPGTLWSSATLARLVRPEPEASRGLLAGLPRLALTGRGEGVTLAAPPATPSQPSAGSEFVEVATAMAARPAPPVATAAADRPVVEQIRVVSLDPLRVAIDCSTPLRYEVNRIDDPPGFSVLFPGATVGARCNRLVALYPAGEGNVTVGNSDKGAQVLVPAREGVDCDAHPGASGQTVVCELVAQRPEPATTPATGTVVVEQPEQVLINLDFQDAPIIEILTALAKYAGKNIVATSAVSGNFSVHLQEVTLTDALDLITTLNNLEYTLIRDKNYVVGSAEEIARLAGEGPTSIPIQLVFKPEQTTPEKIASELQSVISPMNITTEIREDAGAVVFLGLPDRDTADWLQEQAKSVDVPPTDVKRWLTLEFRSPAEVKAALDGLTPNVELLLPGEDAPGTRVIGLVGKSTDVDQAEGLIATIDVDRSQLAPDAVGPPVSESLLVSYIDPEKAVEIILAMFADQVDVHLASSVSDIADVVNTTDAGGLRPTGKILVRGPESVVEDVKEMIAQLDTPPPQVEVTSTITDVRVDKDKDLGFLWELPGFSVSEESTAGGFKVGKISRAAFNAAGSGGMSGSFTANLIDSNATVLERTTLVATNGKCANFLVGDIIPYEVTIAGDGTVTTSVEREEIGIGLKFVPTVDRDENITIFLAPTVRSFSGYSPNGYPIVATREATTIVRVRDGDVIVIGGLLRDEEFKTMTGIPLLKDLPFLGNLFRHRQTQKRKSEIVVFAEVKLLTPEDVSGGVVAAGQG